MAKPILRNSNKGLRTGLKKDERRDGGDLSVTGYCPDTHGMQRAGPVVWPRKYRIMWV